MKDIRVLGIDLAKKTFQLHGVDRDGHAVLRKKIKRSEVLAFVANLRPCIIGMEASCEIDDRMGNASLLKTWNATRS